MHSTNATSNCATSLVTINSPVLTTMLLNKKRPGNTSVTGAFLDYNKVYRRFNPALASASLRLLHLLLEVSEDLEEAL